MLVTSSSSEEVATNENNATTSQRTSPEAADGVLPHPDNPLTEIQEQSIARAIAELMSMYDTKVTGLGSMVDAHWKNMVDARSQSDIAVMEKLELEDRFREKEAGYKSQIEKYRAAADHCMSRIAELKKRVTELEEMVAERDRKLAKLTSHGSPTKSSVRGGPTPGPSKETSPDN